MGFQIKNFFSMLYKTTFDLIFYSLIITIILGFLPNHLFTDLPLDPKSYDITIPDKVENWNNFLVQKSEFLLNGDIVGPESLAEKDGYIYTGLSDGRLIEIDKTSLKFREVTRFGTKTVCIFEDLECGRVLGTRFHRDNYLYVIDFYKGLYRVNVTTGAKDWIDFKNEELNGYYDDLEFDPKLNVVYISVLTTKWSLSRIMFGLMDFDDTGYVFAYNFDTKHGIKLKTGLRLANGLQLTKDNKYLLISETHTMKILKVSLTDIHKSLKTNKQLTESQIQTFAELPGESDNIRLDSNGDVLVGMFLIRHSGKIPLDYLSNWPFIRRCIGRAIYSLSVAIDFINNKTIQSISMKALSVDLYTGHFFAKYLPPNGGVIKLDGNSGQIKQILGSEKFLGVTEAIVDKEGDLYFGSFVSPFLGRIRKGNH